jgi:hypothetical protein
VTNKRVPVKSVNANNYYKVLPINVNVVKHRKKGFFEVLFYQIFPKFGLEQFFQNGLEKLISHL